ncbi:hypothetical protein AWH56_001605 [Anaerobacillus isosaccharinicus]|uniref:Uncharacterized protein n=1 Tax=Anaerobacillus isosaccharinicus TaxID=1532552 RepID=A0A1S2KWP9_9BACI|nr:hypothetical protein [Anaerobacillus isosaccharinicus]MBA5585250.1 hypothetical protein [Anaerobacillus isosaccharinicus]QOY36417.1 hypothetical protein AWH56_001605 [Anaerobacillus isosaccharinicus]
MVTLGSLIIMTFVFLVILIIDMFLYEVSFLGAIQLIFELHLTSGRIYLLFGILFGFASAIIVDFRRKKYR